MFFFPIRPYLLAGRDVNFGLLIVGRIKIRFKTEKYHHYFYSSLVKKKYKKDFFSGEKAAKTVPIAL
jgi:hypothetical protein